MSKLTIYVGNAKIECEGSSNTTVITVAVPDHNPRGEVEGYEYERMSFDTYGQELKDLIEAIEKLKKHL